MDKNGRNMIDKKFGKRNLTEIEQNNNNDLLNSEFIKNAPNKIKNKVNRIKSESNPKKNKIIKSKPFNNINKKDETKKLINNFYNNVIISSCKNKKELKIFSLKKIFNPYPLNKKLVIGLKNKKYETPSPKKGISLLNNNNNEIYFTEKFYNKSNKYMNFFLSEEIKKNKTMSLNNKNKIAIFNKFLLKKKSKPNDIFTNYLIFSEKEAIKEKKNQELKLRRKMCKFGKIFERLNKPIFNVIS